MVNIKLNRYSLLFLLILLSLTTVVYGVPIEEAFIGDNSYKATTKSVSEFRESPTNSFPESIEYEDESGYKGTLSKAGESYTVDSEEIKTVTKYITASSSSNYNSDGYTGKLNRYVTGGEYIPPVSKLVTASVYIEPENVTTIDNVSDTYAYSSDEYSGVLKKANYDILAKGAMVVYYKGEVTKPAIDTRTYLYQGIVSKVIPGDPIYRQDYSGIVKVDPVVPVVEEPKDVVTEPDDAEVVDETKEPVIEGIKDHSKYPLLDMEGNITEPVIFSTKWFELPMLEDASTLANVYNTVALYVTNFVNSLDLMMFVSVGIGFIISLIFLVLLSELFKKRTKFRYLNNIDSDLSKFKRKLKRKVKNQQKLIISEKERNLIIGVAVLMATATNNLTSMPKFVLIGMFIGLGIVLVFQKNRKNKIHTQKIKEIAILFEAIELYMRAGYSMYQALRTSRLLVTHIRPAIDTCLSYWGAGPKIALSKFQEELKLPEAETLILMLVNLESTGSRDMHKAIGGEVFNIESIQKMKVNASISNKPLVMMVYRMMPMASVLGITVGSMLYRTFAMLSQSGVSLF